MPNKHLQLPHVKLSFSLVSHQPLKYTNLPTTGPLSFLAALGLAIHLFMMPKISLFATGTVKH